MCKWSMPNRIRLLPITMCCYFQLLQVFQLNSLRNLKVMKAKKLQNFFAYFLNKLVIEILVSVFDS